MTGLILPEIVYNVKKKLGCIFKENHNSESLDLKRGQTIGLVTSCIVMQEEQGQRPEKRKEDMQSVQSIENRRCYETVEEKRQFIRESFQLYMNSILNADAKLKEAGIKMFLDNFEVLDMHPSQYGETEVLEMKIFY